MGLDPGHCTLRRRHIIHFNLQEKARGPAAHIQLWTIRAGVSVVPHTWRCTHKLLCGQDYRVSCLDETQRILHQSGAVRTPPCTRDCETTTCPAHELLLDTAPCSRALLPCHSSGTTPSAQVVGSDKDCTTAVPYPFLLCVCVCLCVRAGFPLLEPKW